MPATEIKFWGKRGAFWGGLWGLFFGGVFLMVPVVGQVMVLGYLATVIASGVESAVLVGGLSALGAAMYSVGVPKESVIQYRDGAEGGRVSRDGARHGGRTGARPDNPGGRQSFEPRIASRCHHVCAGGWKCRRAVIHNEAWLGRMCRRDVSSFRAC